MAEKYSENELHYYAVLVEIESELLGSLSSEEIKHYFVARSRMADKDRADPVQLARVQKNLSEAFGWGLMGCRTPTEIMMLCDDYTRIRMPSVECDSPLLYLAIVHAILSTCYNGWGPTGADPASWLCKALWNLIGSDVLLRIRHNDPAKFTGEDYWSFLLAKCSVFFSDQLIEEKMRITLLAEIPELGIKITKIGPGLLMWVRDETMIVNWITRGTEYKYGRDFREFYITYETSDE